MPEILGWPEVRDPKGLRVLSPARKLRLADVESVLRSTVSSVVVPGLIRSVGKFAAIDLDKFTTRLAP